MNQRSINKLGQLGNGDEGDVYVVCVTLFFTSLSLYAVNAKDIPWEEIKCYHLVPLIWFTRFDKCAEITKTNQSNMVVEPIGMLFLFELSYFHNKRLVTSESCNDTFGNYHKVEIYFTVDNYAARRHEMAGNRAIYEGDLKMHQSDNRSGKQEAHGDFVKQVSSVLLTNQDYQAKGPTDPFVGTNTHFHIQRGT